MSWLNRADSRVHIIKGSLEMFFDLFKIKWNFLRGVYKAGNRYRVQISYKKKLIQLGSYSTSEEAEQVYLGAYQFIYNLLPPKTRY